MEKEKIEQLRAEKSLGKLLLATHRDFTRRVIEKISRYGHDGLTPSHASLLRYIPLTGARLTDLAEKTEMSKQSVSEVIDELVKKGYLKRVPEEKDLRAKKVCFTEHGEKLLTDGIKAVKEVRAEYAAIIGEEAMNNLESSLSKIINFL
jgi:DNA-binding MarR family transcriptional regulator